MIRIALAVGLILCLGLTHSGSVGAQDVARLQAGVVKITAKPPGGTTNVGTGFIVRADKEAVYIVTAAHVVAGDAQPRVEFFTKRNIPVTAEVLGLEGDDEVRGLALLVVRGPENLPKGVTALSLAGGARLMGGEDILVIGFPRNAGPWALIKGNISSRQGRDVFFSPSVDSGHSGGPILLGGKVVGVVGAESQSGGRGVTVRSVQDYIEGFGITAQESTGSPSSMASASAPLSPAVTAKQDVDPMTQGKGITGRDGAPMVLVPAGTFMMGSSETEVTQAIADCKTQLKMDEATCRDWYSPEKPRHRVTLNAFYLDQYEVSNSRFDAFVRATGHQTTAENEGTAKALVDGEWKDVGGATWRQPEGGETVFRSNRKDHPVVAVSWHDAEAYCRWAGKRLPTEAEFEYATRARTGTTYWWGNGSPGSRRVANIADESAKRQFPKLTIMTGYDDGYVRTAPVGSFEGNQFDLHDMIGNVWEWTADRYGADYYSKTPERNPTGPPSGEYRVLRGGSWFSAPGDVRSATRYGDIPTLRGGDIGFRCAQDVPK